MATKAKKEDGKKTKQFRVKVKKAAGGKCGKSVENEKLMVKIDGKDKNYPEPEASSETVKKKQEVVFY